MIGNSAPSSTLQGVDRFGCIIAGMIHSTCTHSIEALLVAAATAGLVVLAAPDATRLRAQSPAVDAEHPAFDVASVKPGNPGNPGMAMQIQGGRYTATNFPLRSLIMNAYRVSHAQLLSGPSWLTDRFDIVAKAEGNPPPAQMQLMMRRLLADRFKLIVHTDTRELPIYALVVGRSDGKLGSQLRTAAVDCTASRGRLTSPGSSSTSPLERPTCGMTTRGGNLIAGGITMTDLAATLAGYVNRIVQDHTGLTGNFDLDLRWTPDQLGNQPPGSPSPAALPLADGPSIFTAMQEQLGLKLESQKAPLDVLIIDRVEKPTED